ncbi:GNAT family N-acetyltransferase [Umezawaea tangerina]|uniref:Peptidoglycan biosynthesis/recognition protein n=1 Tax=Umezawaea tangerina TaxID=84725 RepID=A0A2T0SU60_9PSEU|nr:GNAT family N-acetyltransferase [Umezawaea tangerina]PRY36940.1 peptidoglycan biosynthesis/recognition protein [Umezawaea tangerina]
MITTAVHHDVEEFAAEYARLAPDVPLHESAAWLRYCDRRSRGRMRYVTARDDRGELLGLTALRATEDESLASANYDVAELLWPAPTGTPPVPVGRLYPQLFAAVSGSRCLFRVLGGVATEVRAALARAASALADEDGSVLTFAYLADAEVVEELAGALGAREHAVVGADTVLDVEWTDFEGYLAGRSRGRRGTIRRERRQYLGSGLTTGVHESTSVLGERTALLQVHLAGKYGVRASVESVLEDYRDLAATLDDDVLVFTADRDGVAVGVCVCLRDGDTLHIRSVGFDYSSVGGDFVYFNLMFYEPLLWGLDNGVRRFRFGNGAYRAKRLRGCRVEPLHGVVRWPGSLAAACADSLALREKDVRAEVWGVVETPV